MAEERIEQTRTALRRGPEGAQTTGWWLQRHGGRVRLLSGENDDPHSRQQQAARFLRDTFPDEGPGLVALSRHVEIQLAVRLRHRATNEVVHEVLVIDRVVCGRDPRS